MEAHARQDQFLVSIDSHKRILARVAQTFCDTPSNRNHLIEEILAQLWVAMPRYDSSRNFSLWMYRIAINTAISSSFSVAIKKTDPHTTDALNRVLVLLSFESYSEREISEIIGIEESLVKARMDALRLTAEEHKDWKTQDEELGRAFIIPPLTEAFKHAHQRTSFSRIGQSLGSEIVVVLFFLTGILAFLIQLKSGELLYFASLAVALFATFQAVGLGYQIKTYMSMDWTDSSVAFYQRLLKLKIARLFFARCAFIVGMFLWLPVVMIVAKGFLGINIYPFFKHEWLIFNGIFGLVVIFMSFVLARFFRPLLEKAGRVGRGLDSLTGQGLSGAVKSLKVARDFAAAPRR